MTHLILTHSILRWIILPLLLLSIIFAYKNKKSPSLNNKIIYLLTLIFTHTQMLLGFILYYKSNLVQFKSETMSNKIFRFFTVEHSLGMIIAIILITIGYSKFKKEKNHNKIFVYYLIATILIFVSIPWPFRNLATSWI
jgi:cell division protein FtsW (lipid II flippase)